jgi:plasmid maintenance system antidote protein VapI
VEKVKQMVQSGVSIPTAIKEALSQNGLDSVEAFAAKYRLIRAAVSNHINGNVRPTDETIAALIAELGGTPDEWRELLWLAAKPAAATA